MKHPFHLIRATALVLLATSTSVFAWPFVKRTGGFASDRYSPRFHQHIAFQSDTDRPLEMFGGGLALIQTSIDANGNLVPVDVDLPIPDFDPYAPSNTAVKFLSGRGDVGDIDGDGDMDIVYTCTLTYNGGESANNVRILSCRNNGNGTWTRIWQLKDVNAPTLLAPEVKLADLDGDGDLDLIETYNGIRVRWNPGDGNFNGTPTVLVSAPYNFAPEIEVADFDGNGWPDIAVFGNVALNAATPGNTTGRITLLSNTGGTFTSSTVLTLSGGDDFEQSYVADLNGDGKSDLITTKRLGSNNSMELVWYRNTGSGFAAPVTLLTQTLAQAPHPLAFMPGDLDGDGLVDIVFSTRFGEIQWLRGIGNGVFNSAAALLSTAAAPQQIDSISVADRDGDGDLDISQAGILFENLAPHKAPFASDQIWNAVNPSGTVDLAVGDINNDGKQDLIVTDPGSFRLRWYAGNGNGLNSPLSINTSNIAPQSVATGDFNRDGKTDLAWTTPNTLTQALSTNANGSTWATSTAATMTGITSILAEDMDGDGDTDILSASPSANILRIHSNNGSASVWSPQNIATGVSGVATIATGQITAGGRPEVASLGAFAVDHHRYSAGAWTKTNITNPSSSTASRAVIIADINDAYPGPETVFALNNNQILYYADEFGAGTNPVTLVTSAQPVNQLAAVDWNGDGFNDLLVATDGGVNLYSGARTNSTIAPPISTTPVPLITGAVIRDIVVMDLDSDGLPDAVAVEASGRLHLLYNRSASVRVTVPGIDSLAKQTLQPGETGTGAYVSGDYLEATYTKVASIAPSKVAIRFRRSDVINGVDTPGTPLSNTEVSVLVESISIYKNFTTLHSETPATISGEHVLNLSTSARTALAITSINSYANFNAQVKLKTTAGSSAVKRFFVDYVPVSSRWTSLDASGASDTTALRMTEETPYQSNLFIVFTPTELETWRFNNFGTYSATGNAANDADPDKDGIPNLVEYVMNRNPGTNAVGSGVNPAAPAIVLTNQGPAAPLLAELRLLTTYDSRVRLTIQRSFGPTSLAAWSTLATRNGTGNWSLNPALTSSLPGGRTSFTFNTGAFPSATPAYFLRLIAEEVP